ncbi:TlpA family protein disulfide reductase [Hanstruepera ponticola]|uniref:TlpA family protein disulfide reductase n=1 Tax=Hanstruepera ponticola TaxID=2042995 RepID=UPI000CF0743D|nr:TlpA disulfide reductase family protein [Hanstruepera ponticola]
MKTSKIKLSNVIFLVVILLLIIPQTRQPIQVFIQKGFALISPSKTEESAQKQLSDYQWELVDQDGNILNFKDVKGKVVFLNFWATWCPPCIAEMPSIDALYQDYNEEVVFLLVSNENSNKVKQFLSDNQFNLNYYNTLTVAPKVLSSNSIPQTYIIDKYGKIRIEKNGAANWNSDTVRNLLDELLKSEYPL